MAAVLIPHSEFGRLRLADFLPAGEELAELADWEFMEARWVGEARGFTEFLRLEADPGVTRSVALDFRDLPPEVAAAVLAALRLPLAAGMRLEEIAARLGPPARVVRFMADRASYEFTCGEGERRYGVSATVHEADGLLYLVVLAPPPDREAASHRDRDV